MSIVVNVDVMLARRKMRLNTLAELVGITPQNLSVLKTGRAKAIRFSTLEKLCQVLDCQPSDLLSYEDNHTMQRAHAVPESRAEKQMSEPQNARWKTRVVRNGFPDREFDIQFWQQEGDEAIFRAAWEMIEVAEELKHGRRPRLQRTVTRVQRGGS